MPADESGPPDFYEETVPFGSAYGVTHLTVQAALRDAACVVLDNVEVGYTDFRGGEQFEATYLVEMLPSGFQELYDSRFIDRFRFSLFLVGWKLAQAEPMPLTCVAEELALHAIVATARMSMENREQPVPDGAFGELLEAAAEDLDVRWLFDVKAPAETELIDISGMAGVAPMDFPNWFKPFGGGVSRGVPHPDLWPPDPHEFPDAPGARG